MIIDKAAFAKAFTVPSMGTANRMFLVKDPTGEFIRPATAEDFTLKVSKDKEGKETSSFVFKERKGVKAAAVKQVGAGRYGSYSAEAMLRDFDQADRLVLDQGEHCEVYAVAKAM